MNLQETADFIITDIDTFDKQCAETEYTDTDQVWDLLSEIRSNLKSALINEAHKKHGGAAGSFEGCSLCQEVEK